MYATCLHCSARLGANEAIEAMPIGRRLAFDAPRGRLWVVCRSCERWNLTPFDERWDALEQCERAFRSTRIRASTDNIGLARLPDGTDLVRIGAPMRPEFAAWRYGDQFGRRRTRNMLLAAGGVVGAGLVASGAALAGVGVTALLHGVYAVSLGSMAWQQRKATTLHVTTGTGEWVTPMGTPRLIDMPDADERWGIATSIAARGPTRQSLQLAPDPLLRSLPALSAWLSRQQAGKNEIGSVQIPGMLALPLLRRVMTSVNYFGARRAVVQDGVQLIDAAGGPEHFARWATSKRREWAARSSFGDTGALTAIPAAARVALEMAIHEDSERRALDGELDTLRLAWQDAESLAQIADGLGQSATTEARLSQLRRDHRQFPEE